MTLIRCAESLNSKPGPLSHFLVTVHRAIIAQGGELAEMTQQHGYQVRSSGKTLRVLIGLVVGDDTGSHRAGNESQDLAQQGYICCGHSNNCFVAP